VSARRRLLALVLLSWALQAAPIAQVQTCGQGVVLRAGGALIIDGWTTYVMPPGFAPSPASPAPATVPGGLTPLAQPTRVILGPSLPGDMPVCVETATGSKCAALTAVRGFIGK